MEALIQTSVSLDEAAFFTNLKKVVYNSRRTFEFFREAVAACKALFKSKYFDSKQKFMALVVAVGHPDPQRGHEDTARRGHRLFR